MPNSGATITAARNADADIAGAVRHDHRHVGAEGVDRGVGDMEDAKQSIDQRQADRHHGIHAAEDETGEG